MSRKRKQEKKRRLVVFCLRKARGRNYPSHVTPWQTHISCWHVIIDVFCSFVLIKEGECNVPMRKKEVSVLMKKTERSLSMSIYIYCKTFHFYQWISESLNWWDLCKSDLDFYYLKVNYSWLQLWNQSNRSALIKSMKREHLLFIQQRVIRVYDWVIILNLHMKCQFKNQN